MVTERRVRRNYEILKNRAFNYLNNGDLELCIQCTRTACTLAKTYYLDYKDDDLESICQSIARIFQDSLPKKNIEGNRNRIVYFDYFALDNAGLALQYLRAIMSWDVEILFISPHLMEPGKSSNLINEVSKAPNVTYYCIDASNSAINQIAELIAVVNEFNPAKAFVHTATDDVNGIIAWYSMNSIERFFVESIDHTFWIGSRNFNHYIVFRDYGYNIASNYRGIDESKIFIQPFYPNHDDSHYLGIKEGSHDNVKLISGGRLVKTYSGDDKYFHIIRRILNENENAVFYYAGGGYVGEGGQTAHTRKLIKKYGLEDRYQLLGFRSDITALLKHMDIYIGTWPMCGGLMTQHAAIAGLPILQYSENGMGKSAEDFLLPMENRPQIVFDDDPEGFFKEASMLIRQPEKRMRIGEQLKECVITDTDFGIQLFDIVYNGFSTYHPKRFQVDISPWRNNRFETENHCEHLYYPIIVNSAVMINVNPIEYVLCGIGLILHSDKKWLLSKVLKKIRKKRY